jgi:hypothetical protein
MRENPHLIRDGHDPDASYDPAQTAVAIKLTEAFGLLWPAEGCGLSQRLRTILGGLSAMRTESDARCVPAGESGA